MGGDVVGSRQCVGRPQSERYFFLGTHLARLSCLSTRSALYIYLFLYMSGPMRRCLKPLQQQYWYTTRRHLLTSASSTIFARAKAMEDSVNFAYWSTAAVERMISEFARKNPGQELRLWQAHVGEALLLELSS
jgi:hypothetical protein